MGRMKELYTRLTEDWNKNELEKNLEGCECSPSVSSFEEACEKCQEEYIAKCEAEMEMEAERHVMEWAKMERDIA